MGDSWRYLWTNSSLSRHWRKTGTLALALVGALLLVYTGTWTPAHGQESPLATPVPAVTAAPVFAPVMLPSISGAITNASGEPLAGLVITAYRRQQTNWHPARQTTTNAAGEYRFPWMPSGSYRLYIRDPQGVYAATYYPNAADIEGASDVLMLGASVSGLNTAIGAGGMITGTLAWPNGPDPFNSSIELYYVLDAPFTTRLTSSDELSFAPELRQYRLVASESFTESVVNYSFTGLAAGSYRVCAEATALRSSLHECFDDASLGIHATDVVVAAGATVANVAIELGDGADLATLSGAISLADATPADGVDVEIAAVPNVDFSAVPQPQRTTTDAAGRFQFTELPFGRYTVRFVDPEGLYLPSNYRAEGEVAAATEIAIDRAAEVTLSAVITAASLITGHVTLDGAIAGMSGQVTAFGVGSDGSWFNGGTGAIVAATGAYTVTGLRSGTYRLQYNVEIPVEIFYGAPGSTLETATEIAVLTETVVGGIDIDLTPYVAGIAYGTLSGQVLAEGVPQANMQIRVFDAGLDCCLAPLPLLATVTDGEGRFSVSGLPPGRYKVGVSGADQPISSIFAPDQRTFETAATYQIGNPADGASRQLITDVNVVIGPVGSLARTVRRPDDTPVVGATVNLFQKLGDPGAWPLVASTVTNDNGQYAFSGVAPDIYQVCLVAVGIAQPSCGGRGGQGLGVDVVVTAGQEATGIDIIDVP